MILPPAIPRGMRVATVGIDLVDVGRIRAARERSPRFDHRVFSARELLATSTSDDADGFLAQCFAVKEALGKALGTGLSGLDLTLVGLGGSGPTEPIVDGRASITAAALGVDAWHATVGFVDGGATAVALVVGAARPGSR